MAMASVAATAGAQMPAGPSAPAQGPSATPQAAQDRYIVGQAKPPEVPGRSVVNLTLEESIQRALDRNIDLKVQRFNPQLTDYQIQQTKAAYRPTLGQTVSFNDATTLSNSTAEGSSTSYASRTFQGNTTFSQTTRRRGLGYSATFSTSRNTTTQTNTIRPLGYTSTMSLQFTQPLLRNFKTDNTRTTLLTQQITREINDITLATSIANTIASVRNAYWDLRSAIENIEIQRRALALATTLVDQNRTKVEVGTMAQIDIIQAESQQANAELSLVNAESTWRTAEMTFKRLIAGGTEDEIFNATVNPTDLPSIAQSVVDINNAVKNALERRTDLQTARKQLESSALSIELLKNQTLPDLGLTGTYRIQGAAGQQKIGSVLTTTGYFDSLTGAYHQPTWTLQMNFNYPIGQQAAKANLARTRLQLEQTQTSLKASELTVTTDVTNAGLSVQNAYKALLASQKAREFAERQAEAEQTKFDVGMSTNFTVVQQQQALTTARLTELRNTLAYIKALVEFERVQSVGR